MKKNWEQTRRKMFKMVSVGYIGDFISVSYDALGTIALIANLLIAFLSTFAELDRIYGGLFDFIEAITVFFFAVDYVLRLVTAKCLYPNKTELRAVLSYVFSLLGVIDLLSFLPYYLPVFFPTGATAFRMFRVARIFRLFRINAYYDSLNVIVEVLKSKAQQLLSSVFIISILILASSLCMYSLEHEAQPEVFVNAFSGIWWAASTLLTVGYGDIYPVTTLGKIMGIILAFLGVGMVAIPTGIISAGFVEQYTRLKNLGDYSSNVDIRFIKTRLTRNDKWVGKHIKELDIPKGIIIGMVERQGEVIIPSGKLLLEENDIVIIGAEVMKNDVPMNLKEVRLASTHPWCNCYIRDLDFSRKTYILSIKRGNKTIIPSGSIKLRADDLILIISKIHFEDEVEITV
ncbi:MAG: potassium channel protein [Butyrivibrio sp.]|nr:potassium channel protein [Butyrivibrio sp.]